MIFRRRFVLIVVAAILACLSHFAAGAGQDQNAGPNRQRLDRQFKAASAAYDSGHFAEAAAQLENLLREVPESFEVHELLWVKF